MYRTLTVATVQPSVHPTAQIIGLISPGFSSLFTG
jgi:hypothetical protein